MPSPSEETPESWLSAPRKGRVRTQHTGSSAGPQRPNQQHLDGGPASLQDSEEPSDAHQPFGSISLAQPEPTTVLLEAQDMAEALKPHPVLLSCHPQPTPGWLLCLPTLFLSSLPIQSGAVSWNPRAPPARGMLLLIHWSTPATQVHTHIRAKGWHTSLCGDTGL